MSARVVVAMSLLAGVSLVVVASPAQEKRERAEEVRRLIGQLDSKDYKEREEATRKLLDLEEDALPALKKALGAGGSPEFRRRAEDILGVFRERQRQRDRVAAIAKGRRVAADLLVERLAVRGKAATADDWQAVGDLAQAMTLWAGDKTNRPAEWFVHLQGDYLQYPLWILETWKDDSVKSLDKRIVIGGDSAVDIARHNVIVCRGSLGIHLGAGPGILLLNGDLKMTATEMTRIEESVVFCDGDVRVERILRSVVVATGKVTSSKFHTKDSVIVEKARNPLPFLKLFETADVGVEVLEAEGSVEVSKVHPGSAFAAGGVRAKDRIVAVHETAVKSAEHFRKLVRRKVAEDADAAITVRRDAKDLKLEVSLRSK